MNQNKAVIHWLVTGCVLIFLMVVIGGITRLTHAGLSISDYKLIAGTLPPLNEQQWQEAFALYKQYPEYQKLNTHFTLEDFKRIYFWEWLHRVTGRLIGLVFILPFLFFWITKKLDRATLKKCVLLLFLGAFQGFLGWYMVKSGLIDYPDVSHYRLAAHLITAFFTFAYSLWVALDLKYPEKKEGHKGMRNLLRVTAVVVLLQMIWGAFVAGLDAGFLHNHWPLMSEGKLIHPTVYSEQQPVLKNFVEGKSGVQFVHRYLACIVVACVGLIAYKARNISCTPLQTRGIQALLILVFLQCIAGVFTLIYAVPLWLGITHQIVAFFLVAALTFTLHRFTR